MYQKAGAFLIAGVMVATMAAAAPAAAAPFPVRCVAPSASSDRLVTAGGFLASVRLAELRYRLPNGQVARITSTSDPLVAAYAASRGTLVQVCTALIRRV